MALRPLYLGHKDTRVELASSVDPKDVEAGMVAKVTSAGLEVAGDEELAVVGLFFTQGYVPAYESHGLLEGQLNAEPGSPGGGDKVAVINAQSVVETDQWSGSLAAGDFVVSDANGKLKKDAGSGTKIGIVVKEADAKGFVVVKMLV
jgi:hypothetical protein